MKRRRTDGIFSGSYRMPSKNALEPIILTLEPKAASVPDAPHEGEEFGYVLQGSGVLHYGEERHRIKKGSSFYYNPSLPHSIENTGNGRLKIVLGLDATRVFKGETS